MVPGRRHLRRRGRSRAGSGGDFGRHGGPGHHGAPGTLTPGSGQTRGNRGDENLTAPDDRWYPEGRRRRPGQVAAGISIAYGI